MQSVLDNPVELFKQCELRRFRRDGRVERDVRWLPADDAIVGRSLATLEAADCDDWEIVSAPDPALPASAVRLFESTSQRMQRA